MATINTLAESGLNDFLDSFLAHPLDFQAKQSTNAFRFPQHVETPMERDLNLQALGESAAPIDSSFSGLSNEVLKAQSFTDVLANVASDWPSQESCQPWGGSFMLGGQWNFPHEQAGQETEGFRSCCLPESSSNNSAGHSNKANSPTHHENGFESERDSDDGQADHPLAKPASGKGKAPTPGRAEQRRTRKREKDRIEELQLNIKKVTEDKQQSEAQNNALAHDLQGKEEQLRKLRAAKESSLPAAEDDDLAASYEESLHLTIQPGKEIKLKPEQIRSMSERDLLALWGLYVARLQELLQAGAAAQQPTQQQQIMLRVNALQREATLLAISPCIWRDNPSKRDKLFFLVPHKGGKEEQAKGSAVSNVAAFKKVLAQGRLDGDRDENVSLEFWRKVHKSLGLSPSQQGLFMELWQSFQGSMSKLMDVRDSIHKHMLSTMPDSVFGRSFAINFLKAHELMDALKFNLRQEHIILCDVAATFYKILTPLQNARETIWYSILGVNQANSR